jgi:hypothetical protein
VRQVDAAPAALVVKVVVPSGRASRSGQDLGPGPDQGPDLGAHRHDAVALNAKAWRTSPWAV